MRRTSLAVLAVTLAMAGAAEAAGPRGPRPAGAQASPRKRAPRAEPPTEPCAGLDALPRRPGPLPFQPGEELAYELTVAGAMVGRMELKVGKPRVADGRTVLPLFGRARTSAILQAFKPFVGRYMALVDPGTLLPIGVRVESTYGTDDRREHVRFSEAQRAVDAEVTLEGQELVRSYRADHALTDVLSMMFAGRRVALGPGVGGCQDVFGSRRLWRMKGTVRPQVEVDTPAGERPAHHVSTRLVRRPTPGLDNRNPPEVRLEVFYGTDGSQVPLGFEVESEGVTARGTLVRWAKGGTSPEAEWTPR